MLIFVVAKTREIDAEREICTFNTNTDANGNVMLQSFVSRPFKKQIGWRYSRIAATGKTRKYFLFFHYSSTRLHAAELVLSRWKLASRWSTTAHATIELRSRHGINPRATRFVSGKANECRWRLRRYQVGPWSRGREVARGVLRSSPKP